MKLRLVFGFLLVPFLSNAQVWVGSDDFNTPSLNSLKWITMPGLSDGFVKTSSGISFQNGGFINDRYGMIAWSQALPKNTNWITKINARIDPAFNTGVTGGLGVGKYLEAIFAVTSDLNTFQNEFANILHRDNNTDISWWTSTNGLYGGTQNDVPTLFTEVVLKIEYDSLNQTLKSSYADAAAPEVFYNNYTWNITPLSGWNEFYIVLGGFSYGVDVNSGILTMDNFNVIPEPSALSLLAVGLGGLALLRQGRKKD